MVDKTHPLLWYLTMNGWMTDEDFAWFQAHRIKEPKRLIVGVDYYPHSEVAWGEHRRIQRHPHAIGLDGVTREYVDRYAPLGCRFAITETNVRGRIADRISWLKYVMETVEKLTSTGIALEGVTWFPFIDSTCWGNLLCNTRGSIDPQGSTGSERIPLSACLPSSRNFTHFSHKARLHHRRFLPTNSSWDQYSMDGW
jgi:hypothetical protein